MFQHIYTGVGQAIQPIAANNYGAGQVLRIFRLRRISLATVTAMGIGFYHFGFAVSHADHKIFHGCHSGGIKGNPCDCPYLFFVFPVYGDQYLGYLLLPGHHADRHIFCPHHSARACYKQYTALSPPAWLGIDGVWWAMVITEGIVAVITLICVNFATEK